MFIDQKQQKRLAVLLIAGVAALLTILLSYRLTDSPNAADGYQNLRTAYNLAYHGIFSTDIDLKPSNYREPLPIAVLAIYIKMHPRLSSGQSITSINQDSAVLAIKQHNLIWGFLCLLGVGVVVFSAVRSSLVGLIAAIFAAGLTYFLLLQRNEILNRTYTEIQTATLLIWCSFALIRALQTRRPAWFAAAGLLLGALILTKASFLYVGIGLIAVLSFAYGVWRPPLGQRWRTFGHMSLMFGCMTAVVVPWMVRNFVEFGSFQVTQRGGTALMIRANYDTMNDAEYAGAFYHFARSSYLKQFIGSYLGFSPKDLEIGGRLQRLNRDGSASFAASDLEAEKAGRPDDAISFYRAARAERRRLTAYFRNKGVEHPTHRADEELQRKALGQFIADPVKHMKTSILFMWQGFPKIGNLVMTIVAFLAIWTMAVAGLLRRDGVMIGIALIPVGAFMFFALASHFSPRLSAPMVPNLIIALVVTVVWAIQWFLSVLPADNLKFGEWLRRPSTQS